ncbi:isoamyl alcohol oxidase [Pseudovirgaria hyperparasitica]|uniref:Isoamyl alcohol oxidase n=1 Tax=Pseudovirgaria hyperparasitica TaxID=470096 RepID=A0A6A6VXK4_9PEZI|nr:isoamyl alcohol oxidase [Pseudovirgaria hyperparasitica]KAF2755342.1 isoamyl alcohol oxidase [Pseudovirgaria hyperparasitica]
MHMFDLLACVCFALVPVAALSSDADILATANTKLSTIVSRSDQKYSCKCYPGDHCWPAADKWNALNTTVNGALRSVVPAAAVCHESFQGSPTYNAEACAEVNKNIHSESWWTDQPIETMWTYWSNNTCTPDSPKERPCTLGFSPSYVIMATEIAHIKAGIDFARQQNVRLIIRNTGHDFMGRSNGYGALAINTHKFKDISFTGSYAGPGDWKGGAVTVGAGVQLRELYTAAHSRSPSVLVMGGECPTVGIAGGYIQGGGHGIMGTWFGMAADNALAFTAITAEGEYVTANANENADLFWALKGGGPASYAVITSLTLKTFPEMRAAGTILNINATHTNDSAVIWKGVEIFHSFANLYVDNGFFVYYELLGGSLHVQPFVAPNMDAAGIKAVLAPLFAALDAASIPYSTVTKDFSSVYDLYIDLFEDEPPYQNTYIGGRIFTRDDISSRNPEIINSYKVAAAPAPGYVGGIVGHIVGPGHNVSQADNAIHPAWRSASSFSIALLVVDRDVSLAQRQAAQDVLTHKTGDAMRAASPDGGAYVNEGDLNEPDWQRAYWGDKYPRLLELRRKWDPKGVFYARTTPGTEEWEVLEEGTRLCKRN